MRLATATIKGLAPLQFGKYHQAEKTKEKESKDAYEKRTWREKAHYNKEGVCFIPPMALKKTVQTAARFLGIQIPGKGKANYTKHFKSGILVTEGLNLGVSKDETEGLWVFSGGTGAGSTTRVMKCFPTIQEWAGSVIFYILDDIIPEDVFERVLKEAGNFIGLGVFRPENGGYYGRFEVESVKWSEQ